MATLCRGQRTYPGLRKALKVQLKNKAFITLKKNVSASEKEFRRFCHEKIAMYKNPKYFEFRDSLPKTPTGKVMKKILKEEERERVKSEE